VEQSGTTMRFVNRLARALAKDYPNVSIETYGYYSQPPRKALPESNVIIKWVTGTDHRYAIDDPTFEKNRKQFAEMLVWKNIVGKGWLYSWTYLTRSPDFMVPNPNLHHLARNIRIMNNHRVRGMFAQMQQSRATQMQNLRYYLAARCMWRPQTTDGQKEIEEFCYLYYNEAGDDVLDYIDFLHDEYGDKAPDASKLDQRFIEEANVIFDRAEAKVTAPEVAVRVATYRLPVWKLMLDRAFGTAGQVHDFPVTWYFRLDLEDQGQKDGWEKTTDFEGWRTMRIDKHWPKQGEKRRGVA